ncbi:MAG: FlgD immunoglobulin-like domain containing protein, partial [Candidatus Tenebribacter burtonii]|nr:FlgD immunoglobulin-like domain containing protein [Candidatus Tenebribacter burtonii]
RTHKISNRATFEAEFARDIRRTTTQQSSSRSLAGYTVYRDGAEIADIADPATLEYLDESLNAGTYEYTIEAYYTSPDGISDPTEPVTATVVLDVPINVVALSIPPNIMVTWSPPNRGVDSYNVYRDSVMISEGEIGTLYIDINISGYHYWNITAVYDGGWESEFSETVGVGPATDPNLIPLVTALNGNFPNPFNPETTISFSVSQTFLFVNMEIYNLKGQKIKTLLNEILPAGIHSVVWNGTDDNSKKISSGVYLYKMQVGNYSKTKKMILIK